MPFVGDETAALIGLGVDLRMIMNTYDGANDLNAPALSPTSGQHTPSVKNYLFYQTAAFCGNAVRRRRDGGGSLV